MDRLKGRSGLAKRTSEFRVHHPDVQRVVELQESWRIMVEFNTHGGAGQQYQDHKVHFNTDQCMIQCFRSF